MRYRVTLACGLTVLWGAAAQADDKPACQPSTIGAGQVQTVLDGRTVRLADGREVRLGGIETPPSAKAALESLVSGRAVTLQRLHADSDRYGRIVALVTTQSTGRSVQETLLAQGYAQVSANPGDPSCAAALLAAEAEARSAGLGLWADPYYVVRRAEDPEKILAVRGHFVVVSGQVLSVRESGGLIYVNFGRRWADDFTVTVSKRNERRFTAAGLELKKLAGHKVRVRGIVEERGGPWIEVARPGQIEIAERN